MLFKYPWTILRGQLSPKAKCGQPTVRGQYLIYLEKTRAIIQGVFFNWFRPKSSKYQITSKSSKCQNLLTDRHLELFGRDQLKETPCRLHLLALVASIRLILCHPRLQARLLPRVAKLPRRWPRRTKRRGRARGRSPLPSTFTRLYRLDTSKTLRILMYIRFQVLKQVHPHTWVSSMAISIINSLR